MSKHGYLVHTAMGNTLLDTSDSVWVRVNADKYLEKRVVDLKAGDMVVYSKPYAKTSLADVEPFLTKSPRYSKAKDMIHEVNSKGTYIPKLRTFLTRGLANNDIVSREYLEEKVLFENNKDFSKAEYDCMNNRIYETLVIDNEPQMGSSGINEWLRGKVLAPRNWNLFKHLAKEINPDFKLFKDGDEDPRSMYFNYRLYVSIRQGVMRFLNQSKGLLGDEGWNEAENKISLSPEYAIVFDHFLKDLNMDYAAARINLIEKIDGRANIDGLKKQDELIEQGVVLSSRINLPRKNYKEIIEDQEILYMYLCSMIEDFDCGYASFNNKTVIPNSALRGELSHYVIPYLMEGFGEKLDSETMHMKEMSKKPHVYSAGDCTEFCDLIKNYILNREVDKSFGFKHGESQRLMESYFRLRTAMPNRIHDFTGFAKRNISVPLMENGLNDISSRIIKEAQQMVADIKKKYDLEYDILGNPTSGGIFLSHAIPPDVLFSTIGQNDDVINSRKEALDILRNKPEKLKELINLAKSGLNKGAFFRSKNHTLNTLKEYGLEEIVDLRKQDFYWEEVI